MYTFWFVVKITNNHFINFDITWKQNNFKLQNNFAKLYLLVHII